MMLISQGEAVSHEIKKLIEFMDAPSVCAATPSDWQERVGDARLEAVFVCPDLGEVETRAVVEAIGQRDPNIPIVIVAEGTSG
jgi:hypothetical protein